MLGTGASRKRTCTVDKRCAMIRVVRDAPISLRLVMMSNSVSLSSALVASSQSKMGASFNMARAIATRCFSPPDSLRPRSPTTATMATNEAESVSRASECACLQSAALTSVVPIGHGHDRVVDARFLRSDHDFGEQLFTFDIKTRLTILTGCCVCDVVQDCVIEEHLCGKSVAVVSKWSARNNEHQPCPNSPCLVARH